MSIDQDEFRHIPIQREELGLEATDSVVRRQDVVTAAGAVSTLVWGERPGVTFLHGAGLNAHTWDETILVLDRPALAIDLPGHGDSAWREDFDYRPETTAVALAETLDVLAPGTPQVIVGQSLGGVTAIALASLRPDLVRALVIVDVSPGLRAGDAAQVSDFLAGPQVFPSRDDIVEKALAAGIGSSRAALARGVELNTRVRPDGSVVFKHHLASPPEGITSFALDFSSLWSGIEATDFPVLLVRGTHGFVTAAALAEFIERVPRATVVEIEAGHNVQEQQPVALGEAIASFIDSLPNG